VHDFLVRIGLPVGMHCRKLTKNCWPARKLSGICRVLQSVFALIGSGGGFRTNNKGFMFVTDQKTGDGSVPSRKISLARKEMNSLPGVAAYVEDVTIIGRRHERQECALQLK